MQAIYCDGCDSQFDKRAAVNHLARVRIGDDRFIYYYIGDSDGEPIPDEHLCRACLIDKLDHEALAEVDNPEELEEDGSYIEDEDAQEEAEEQEVAR